MSVTVVDNPTESRFEAWVDGALAGVSEYELTSDTIIFLHTNVDEQYEGQGVGSEIARSALDDARARGLYVRPLCPFIRDWLKRHSRIRRPHSRASIGLCRFGWPSTDSGDSAMPVMRPSWQPRQRLTHD